MAQQYGVDIVAKVAGANNIVKLEKALSALDRTAGRASKQLPAVGRGAAGAGSAAAKGALGVKAFSTAVKSALGPIGGALAAIGGLSAAFQAISGQDFAVAKVKSLGVNAGELNAELKKVSAELEYSASVAELTSSAYDVASAGFTDAADAAQVLKAASMGATGGFTDMNTAGDALTSVLNAYNLSADEATATMDKFIQTQNDGKITVAEYGKNIAKVSSAAAALGVPLGEVNAIIAQSTAAGNQAEIAFTGLKSAIARLASGEANKELEKYGVSISAASIESEGLAASLKKITDAGVDTGTLLKALGQEAGPALLPVLGNMEKFNELLKNQENSAGAAAKANKLATDTIKGAWKQLTNVFSNFFTDQTAAASAMKLALQGLTIVIKNILNAVNLVLTPFKVLVGIIDGLKQATNALGQGFAAAFDSPEGRAFLEVVKLIQAEIAKATAWVGEKFSQAWSTVLTVVTQVGTFIGTTLVTQIDNTVTALSNFLGGLPLIGDNIKAAKKQWDSFKEKIEDAEQATEELAKSTDGIDAGIKDAQRAAISFAEAQRSAADESLRAAEATQQMQKDSNKLLDAEYSLRSALLDTQKQSAQVMLDSATNMKEVVKASKQIYEATVEQAKLDRDLAKTKADAAVDELKSKEAIIQATLVQVEAEKAILIALKQSTKQVDQQMAKVMQQLDMLASTISTHEKIRDLQHDQADAIYDQAVAAAKLAKEQNIQAGKERLSSALNKDITASKKAQTAEMAKQSKIQDELNKKQAAGSGGGAGGGSVSGGSYATQVPKELAEMMRGGTTFKSLMKMQEFYKAQDAVIDKGNEAIRNQKRYNDLTTKAAEYAAAGAAEAADLFNQAARIVKASMPRNTAANLGKSSNLPKYGSGGYVNGAQTAVIGESGPEYVIPAKRMDTALANYAAGKRGDAVLNQQVNVTTGPVQQMDGTNYVTLQQATSMSQSAARQGAQMALTQIKTDPGTRRAIGVGS